MSKSLNCNPASVANASGFPLQMRLADIAKTSGRWKLLGEEHPWSLQSGHSEGFIDLILLDIHEEQTIVVECKRVKQTVWVFLLPKTNPEKRSHARLWVSSKSNSKWEMLGWSQFQVDPQCHESKYCAIPGQDHGRHNLLERTASELIASVEALALQERELTEKGQASDVRFRRCYIPVIVTTAQLQVACFDPSEVSLVDGTLPAEANFSEVPYVRLRKALTNSFSTTSQTNLTEAYQKAERTVFIVNAEKFGDFLYTCEVHRSASWWE